MLLHQVTLLQVTSSLVSVLCERYSLCKFRVTVVLVRFWLHSGIACLWPYLSFCTYRKNYIFGKLL
jgi:hypothetical protein